MDEKPKKIIESRQIPKTVIATTETAIDLFCKNEDGNDIKQYIIDNSVFGIFTSRIEE